MPYTIPQHYERLAQDYDSNWAYSTSFITAMTKKIISVAGIVRDDIIADLGGGTGLYARELVRLADLSHQVYCIDPSPAMLSQVPPSAKVEPVQASAEDLAAAPLPGVPATFDVILIKEAVHHFTSPAEVISGLVNRLAPNGRLVVVMLPKRIEYPLFERALQRFTELQPDPADIATHMRTAELAVSESTFEFPLEFPQPRYLDMVRSCYMSVLSTFSDQELDEGVREVQQRYPGPMVSFVDRFAIICGTK